MEINMAKQPKKMKQEVAKIEDSEAGVVALGEMPDYLKATAGDNRGNENVTTNDVTIPRLEIVQSLSGCRKKDDPGYIKGAEEGMLYNNVTRELYGESVQVIPVAFRKEYLLWRDLKKGGGFGGAYPSMKEAESAKAEQEVPAEWEIVDTHQHYALAIKDGKPSPVAISMSKSKAKVSRKWNSLIQLGGNARFSRVYKISGVSDQNDTGQSFYNMSVATVGFTPEVLFRKAEEFYKAVSEGNVKVGRDQTESEM
jgi:hypothetical protein